MGETLGELIGSIVVNAEKKLRAPQGGTKLNCFFKCRDRGSELVLKVPDEAQALQSLRIRTRLETGFVFAFCGGVVARCFGFFSGSEMVLYSGNLARQDSRAEK